MHPQAVVSLVLAALQTLVWAIIAVLAMRVYVLPSFRKEVATSEPDRHADADPDAD